MIIINEECEFEGDELQKGSNVIIETDGFTELSTNFFLNDVTMIEKVKQ